jgi:neutral amino acid transport system permease protein
MLHEARYKYSNLSRGTRRILIATILFVDANLLGTSNGIGILNIVDTILGDGIPNDLVWLLQVVESLTAGFIIIKVFFDDVPPSNFRTLALLTSPLFMIIFTFLTLDILLNGLGEGASFTLDLVSVATGTLTWSSTYLAIAIGLTLTYKVQRYGNFAQSELFMIGMYLSMIMIWSDYFFPLSSLSTTKDGVLTWSVLIFTLISAFILTGLAGVIIDRLVYRGFRRTKATPQVMMIASLGVALILRAMTYLRFGSGRNMFEPEGDWRMPNLRWEIPTTKLRLNLGDRSIDEGRTYTQWSCEQTGVDETTGEPILSRIVSEASKPAYELYDTTADCVTQATTNYAYYKGAVPFVIFSSVLLLMLLLNKTRLGRRMRAVADNPELAASSGINVERVHLSSAFLSAGISGMGGAIFAMTLRFSPETAFTLLLPSFAIIVLGTIGSIPGAIVGSIIVGFVRALSSPVLIGIGSPLGRSNYSALDGVMPYIFLVAILMIMPEGIGNAYEKWKIDRLRNKKEANTERDIKIATGLAFLPTGIFGLHHWWRGRTHRMQTFSVIAIASYVFHRFSNFVETNSFADGSCADSCQENEFAQTNLAILTGRNDGEIILEDSPLTEAHLLEQTSAPSGMTPFEAEQWIPGALADMQQSWLNQMRFEIDLVNFIVGIGDLIWPLALVVLWAFSVYEGIRIMNGRENEKLTFPPFSNWKSIIDSTPSPISDIRRKLFDLDRKHERMVKRLNEKLSNYLKPGELRSHTLALSLRFLEPVMKAIKIPESRKTDLKMYGRQSPLGSWISFYILITILVMFLVWLPIAESDNYEFKKVLQVSNVLLTLSIFILMAFSLNLHTGYTGMVNFGIIFFVSIGAITVSILTAPERVFGYDWGIMEATIVAMLLSAAIGWLLAYPTARLRTDYFAIVTISLGEIVRVLLAGEPLLRAGPVASAIGISGYPLPLEDWWFCGSEKSGPDTQWASPDACRDDILLDSTPAHHIGELLNLGEPAPYMMMLMLLSVASVIIVWALLSRLLSSPWGRVLKAIREDEEVAQHHGHDILTHKAASLALGAAIAALAGALWAWKLTGFDASFMSPARSTFLVWAAFIIGGTSNNRGMVVGAFIIVLMEFVFNVLVAAQGSSDLPLHVTADRIDALFEWIITNQWDVATIFAITALVGYITRSERLFDIGFSGAAVFLFAALALGERSINESFFAGAVSADMVYIKLMLIGCLMLFSLKFNSKGLLPEVPIRPSRPDGGE